jgi:hypothetical protein
MKHAQQLQQQAADIKATNISKCIAMCCFHPLRYFPDHVGAH